MNQYSYQYITRKLAKGTKILFACFPADGHFNPMTGIAVHLQQQGYDVRWYTGPSYKAKVEKLGIPYLPFEKALEVTGENVNQLMPERSRHKSQIARLNFDAINVFIRRGEEYYEDIKAIHAHFPFELMVADVLFTGIPFVSDLLQIPVLGVGVVPITKNSRDLPPAGIGMTPSNSWAGRLKQHLLRWVAKHVLFAQSNKEMLKVFGRHGIRTSADTIFDLMPSKCAIILQTGTPGFEYQRSDLDPAYKFVGPLLPYSAKKFEQPWSHQKLAVYKKVVLVTQGTVEKDAGKLLVPTLEALQHSDCLVIVTTGGSDTEKLRAQYNAPNIIIEDFIPFDAVMPLADVYITNGGMGGVQLSIQHRLPMVVAGVHEGKNEICARVGYFKLGINLKTERPTPGQIRASVEEVTRNNSYRKNVAALSREFAQYNANQLCEQYIQAVLGAVARSGVTMATIY